MNLLDIHSFSSPCFCSCCRVKGVFVVVFFFCDEPFPEAQSCFVSLVICFKIACESELQS